MNEIEKKEPTAPEPNGLQAQLDALQRQVTLLMAALVISSATFCVYMGLMMRRAQHDLKSTKEIAIPNIQFHQKQKSDFAAFAAKLADYGKSHPDFAPIINKYRISVSTNVPPKGATAPQNPQPAPTQPSQPKNQ
jgi:hypothetical protein